MRQPCVEPITRQPCMVIRVGVDGDGGGGGGIITIPKLSIESIGRPS